MSLTYSGPEVTAQIEGVARLLSPGRPGDEDLRETYFDIFADGRDRMAWPGIVHWAVRPCWARLASYEEGGGTAEFEWDETGTIHILNPSAE